VERLTHGRQRVELLDGPMAVNGLIAKGVYDPGLVEDRFASDRLEAGVVDQSAQVVLVGQVQRPPDLYAQVTANSSVRRA